MQEVSETSAKSEVVTTCSWQFPGDARLHSMAIILIMSTFLDSTEAESFAGLVPHSPLTDQKKVGSIVSGQIAQEFDRLHIAYSAPSAAQKIRAATGSMRMTFF